MNYEALSTRFLSYCRHKPTRNDVVKKINAIKFYDVHVLVIEIFLKNCIQTIFNYGVGIHTTKKVKYLFHLKSGYFQCNYTLNMLLIA